MSQQENLGLAHEAASAAFLATLEAWGAHVDMNDPKCQEATRTAIAHHRQAIDRLVASLPDVLERAQSRCA